MVEFRTVPIDAGVRAVRAWAEMDWPVTSEQAAAMRNRLGWSESSEDARAFTTDFGLDSHDGSLGVDHGLLAEVAFRLSTLAPRGTEGEVAERSWAAFAAYEAAFTALWGRPKQHSHRGVKSDDWVLPNGAQVMLAGLDRMIKVEVESPALREMLEATDDE
nr:DUF6301 family protein [Propioniciclava soli]